MFFLEDAFTSMLSRTSALIPDSLFESLGMPRGEESMLDARHVSPTLPSHPIQPLFSDSPTN